MYFTYCADGSNYCPNFWFRHTGTTVNDYPIMSFPLVVRCGQQERRGTARKAGGMERREMKRHPTHCDPITLHFIDCAFHSSDNHSRSYVLCVLVYSHVHCGC